MTDDELRAALVRVDDELRGLAEAPRDARPRRERLAEVDTLARAWEAATGPGPRAMPCPGNGVESQAAECRGFRCSARTRATRTPVRPRTGKPASARTIVRGSTSAFAASASTS